MKLKDIGEFGFIERFKPLFGHLTSEGQLGIGDDCAIIPGDEKEDWLITTDMLMEDVHFLREAISPEELGHKSLAVNLSDIAAMGGHPVGSFLSIAIPQDMDVEYLDAFMNGYHKLSEKYHTPLLGGDTTKSMKHLAINVCVIGKCEKGKAKKRSMAQTGDLICVTGYLGDSAGGLKLLLDKIVVSGKNSSLIHCHHLPEPRLAEGQYLANLEGVHAMMDVSDGIASDLKHILKASAKAAIIHVENIPISPTLKETAWFQKWDALSLATSGGEDYELLIAVDRLQASEIRDKFGQAFGKELYIIGEITNGTVEIVWKNGEAPININLKGFDHFK